MNRKVVFWILCGALFFTLAAQLGKSYRAERFDVVVDVQPDGSLLVNETVTFNFTGGPFTFVFRELPTDHTDGITDIVAGVDGVAWPLGDGPGQVEITGDNPIRVVWHLPPTADATNLFTLSYRPLGVVRRGDRADVLDWQALPDEYDYTIDAAEVRFTYPTSAVLAGQPQLLAGDGDGWQMTQSDGLTRFTAQNLSPDDPFVARLPFAPGTFVAAPPEWQARQAAQNSLAWVWFVVGALVLAIGLPVFIRAARPYTHSALKATTYAYKPPVDLPPALAGWLADGSVSWYHGLATLFDLAGRGALGIEQVREKTAFRSPDFAVTLLERPQDLWEHEDVMLDLLFIDKKGDEREVVTFSKLGALTTTPAWKEFVHTVEDEATTQGLLDPRAVRRRKQLIGWGVALMLLGLPLAAVAFLVRELFGMWPLVAVGAVFLVGFVGFVSSAGLSLLSPKGLQVATAFGPFRRLLRDVAGGKIALPDPAYFEAYLPYAATYGVAESWVKRQEKTGVGQLPSYFRAMGGDGAQMAAFVAAISTASHAGGAAGAGAAGAAAAGGGASGAG